MLEYILNFFKQKENGLVDMYCQECGIDITGQPAEVVNVKTYCVIQDQFGVRCAQKAVYKEAIKKGKFQSYVFTIYTSQEVQKMVKKRTLKEFGPLEKKVQ